MFYNSLPFVIKDEAKRLSDASVESDVKFPVLEIMCW